jgi:hypothetical protein
MEDLVQNAAARAAAVAAMPLRSGPLRTSHAGERKDQADGLGEPRGASG